MWVLKTVGYIVAAIAVLTALVCGGLFLVFLAIALGMTLYLVGMVITTAGAIRAFWEGRSDGKEKPG